jgi:hypothetical protein
MFWLINNSSRPMIELSWIVMVTSVFLHPAGIFDLLSKALFLSKPEKILLFSRQYVI